jgi:hypothetical protein
MSILIKVSYAYVQNFISTQTQSMQKEIHQLSNHLNAFILLVVPDSQKSNPYTPAYLIAVAVFYYLLWSPFWWIVKVVCPCCCKG